MGYEDIRVTDELDGSVQRAVGVSPQRNETLGGLVKGIAAERWVRQLENLVSQEPTRHEIRVDGHTLYTYCFIDALMLPFVARGRRIEVCSESPGDGGEVTAVVTEEGVEGPPQRAVVSFGAAWEEEGTTCETLCPYLNAFPSRVDYERWARETPEAETVALSVEEAFDLARDWISHPAGGSGGGICRC